MKVRDVDVILVPGAKKLAPNHWQKRWDSRLPNAQTVDLPSNSAAQLRFEKLQDLVLHATRPVILVGHCTGNYLIEKLAREVVDTKVIGALFVSLPDLTKNGKKLPDAAQFEAPQTAPLPFASITIISDTDPRADAKKAAEMAADWGSDFHITPEAGRIDTSSGHGSWPDGLMMLARLLKRAN